MLKEQLTEENFNKHLNTTFFISIDERRLGLELTELKGYRSQHEEQQGLERFSVYFNGPLEPIVPQNTYRMVHEQMGAFEIFLVPVARGETELRYEAVFNFFK